MLLDVEKVHKQRMNFIGFSTKASLNEDIQLNIVKNLREQVLIQLPFIKNRIDNSIFLIQVYDEEE